MDISNVYEHKPPASVKPESMVMLLHGLGADGRDLLSLAPLWARNLPGTVFISPDAPFPCDMAPMGYQWFSLQEWTPESILQGVKAAAPILERFIKDQLEKYDIPANKLALAGFSQGTMMSLYAGLRHPETIAGVLGYSGALVGGEEWTRNPDQVRKIPVHLIHGDADTIVPVSAYHHAKQLLEQGGFAVSGHITPGLMHGIDQAGIESGARFLKQVLL